MEYEPTFTNRYEHRRLRQTAKLEQDVHPIKGFLVVAMFIGLVALPALLGLN